MQRSKGSKCVLRLYVAVILQVIAAVTVRAQPLHDPALRFRTIRTAHFALHFHQGEDALAARLGIIAEETWERLAARLTTPPPLTHVVLVDETELANGSATPLPYNTMVITAAWPAGSEFIGNTDDWLRLVFTHEFTHIVHLDRSESWARLVRNVFGRVTVAFPNLFLPTWQIEGLATYEESAITGQGRLYAGDFLQIAHEAARQRALEPLDRVNGGLTDWPNGLGPYAYGLGFHAYLAERFGEAKFRELADRTARRVPYTGSRVFRDVYGRSLGDLWRDYEESLHEPAASAVQRSDDGPGMASGTTSARRLTFHGFYVSGPRFVGKDLLYSIRTPHDLPSLNRVSIDGGRSTRIVTRYLGSTLGIGRGAAYFDQQELRRNAGLYSDLYVIDLRTNRVRQLTHGERLIDPDLSPDGKTIAAVRDLPGQRELVTLGVQATVPVAIASAPNTQFNAPRWSPDGRLIVVERHVSGALSDIVVFDVATHTVRAAFSGPATRLVTPAWTPDGRTIIAASAPENEPFQLVAIDFASGSTRRLTNVPGGALWPEVSPDGETLVYVGYTVAGFDLFKVKPGDGFDGRDSESRSDRPRRRNESQIADPESRPATQPAAVQPRPYSPLPTLPPTFWTPLFTGDRHSLRVGAATGGVDVLGYHAYGVSATWLATHPAAASIPSAATPDWQVAYAYTRWRPAFFVSLSSDTSFFAGPATESGTPSEATLREREVQAGVAVPVNHVRIAHTAFASFIRAADDFMLADKTTSLTRAAVRGGWTTRTAHMFGYSISRERGIVVGGTIERVDPSLGASATADAATADLRLYIPGVGGHHVAAIRVAGGTSSGNRSLRRTFHLGGSGPNSDPLDFGQNAISLLRGFPIDTFAGRNVALLNADYRFPIARVERGTGTWPLFLHTVYGAVFADAGHTWTRTFRWSDAKQAIGGELSADVVLGYGLTFTATAGVAYGRDGSGLVANGTTTYIRIGHAF